VTGVGGVGLLLSWSNNLIVRILECIGWLIYSVSERWCKLLTLLIEIS